MSVRQRVLPGASDERNDEDEEEVPQRRQTRRTQRVLTPSYAFTDLDIVGFARNFVYNIYVLLLIPFKIAVLLLQFIFWMISIIYPILFYLIIIWLFWYLLIIYWPYVMQVIIVVFIPIANVLIILFNLFFMIAVIIAMILITVWNAFVPFIGMILYVLINVISTILADVYNAIGSIDWEPIISGFMQILQIIVQIAVQILVVLIKVGSEILMALAKVIGPILKILLTFVKILLPIVAWILKLLYYILSPILQILAAFFGGGNPAGARTKPAETTARRLFSIELSKSVLNQTVFAEARRAADDIVAIPDGLAPEEREEFERFLKSIGKLKKAPDEEDTNDFFTDTIRDALEGEAPPRPVSDFQSGRRLFASTWNPLPKNNNLRFVDEDVDKEESEDGLSEAHLDTAAHQMAREMYIGSKGLSSNDMSLAMDTMHAIMTEHKRQGDLSIQSTMRDYARKSRHLEPAFSDTLASIHYDTTVEHPERMYARFHQEAQQRAQQQFSGPGRKLLENWKDVNEEKIAGLRIEHARAVLEQQKKYRHYQETHHKVVTVVYASVTKSLKHAFEEGITPTNVMKHWDSMLRSFGYKSIQEVRMHFENTHGDAVNFMNSFSVVSELPFFRYFKRADPSRIESPYFHDWAIEQSKLKKDKEAMHGRRLMQMQFNQDKDVRGNGDSKGALSGFATFSSRDCFSSPKNSLCIPNIPPSFQLRIPLIKLTKKQTQALLQDTSLCQPWRLTYCLICTDRFYNAWQSFRWLLSAIPPINYPIARLTLQAPWTGFFFDWIFLVPKYHTTSFRQAICFAYNLYDVFVSLVVIWLLLRIVPPFIDIIRSTYQNVRAGSQWNKQRPWTDVRRQRLIEQWALRFREMDIRQQERQIGAPYRQRTEGEEWRDESTSVARQIGANIAERYVLMARQRLLMEEFQRHMRITHHFDEEHTEHIRREIQSHMPRPGPQAIVIRRDEDDDE